MTKGWGDIYLELEHAITEIDLELHQWQEDLDMMSFIGYNASVELWTNDDPPRVITKDVLAQAAGKELRVMHHIDGEWTKVGTAKIDENGLLTAEIEKDVPELRKGTLSGVSIAKPAWVDWDIDNNIPVSDPRSPHNPLRINHHVVEAIENHPFFKDSDDEYVDRTEILKKMNIDHRFFKEQDK